MTHKTWYSYVVLLCIIILGGFVRSWQLSAIPNILNPDEASIAYNAYLLNATGADEFNRKNPLILEAFGDQKVAGYTALVRASFWLFGLSDAAVRIPATLAGIALLPLTYYILRRWKLSPTTTHIALLILAIQPVFIWYSRVAFEATIALAATLACIALLYTPQVKTGYLRLIAVIVMIISACFLYNAPLVLVPLLLFALPFWQGVRNHRLWRWLVLVGLVAWAMVTAFLLSLTEQKSQITLFADPTTPFEYGAYREQFTEPLQTLIGNKIVFYGLKIAENYLDTLSLGFMTRNVDGHAWHTLSGYGYLTPVIYYLGWIGVGVAIAQLLRRRVIRQNSSALLLFLVVIGIAPAAITVNAPHATRSLLFFWAWAVLASSAVDFGIKQLRTPMNRGIATVVISLIIMASSLPYLNTLFRVYPTSIELQAPLLSGFDTTVQAVANDQTSKQVAIVDTRGFHYILTAWYTRMPATEFRATVVKQLPDVINFRYGERVGKYHFIMQPTDSTEYDTLLYWDTETLRWVVEK